MPRIVGVDVPNDKPLWIGLTHIFGIGPHRSRQICAEAGIEPGIRAKKLTEDEVSRIAQIIDRNYVVEGQLKRQVSQNISRLIDIHCYRGMRHRKGLPVRGQQTQSNARTRKGPRKTVAGKKGVKEVR
jgi:small subunit ribosomal protein S13